MAVTALNLTLKHNVIEEITVYKLSIEATFDEAEFEKNPPVEVSYEPDPEGYFTAVLKVASSTEPQNPVQHNVCMGAIPFTEENPELKVSLEDEEGTLLASEIINYDESTFDEDVKDQEDCEESEKPWPINSF